MSRPEDQPVEEVAVGSSLTERPKGPVRVLFEVELGSEIQMARFMEQFALGLMVVGVQGSDIKRVATVDRVTNGPDGERILERIPEIGPRQ